MPALDSKIGFSETSSDRIRESPVVAFHRSIFERGFSPIGSDFIPFGSEKISNIWIIIEFAALIQADILVLARLFR